MVKATSARMAAAAVLAALAAAALLAGLSRGGYTSVAEEYEMQAARYDERYAAYVQQTVENHLAVSAPEMRALSCKNCDVVDVGCGTGALASAIKRAQPRWHVVCAEPSEPMLARARLRPEELTAVQAKSEALPFADESFDMATSLSSLHFWDDRLAGLREMARVLRKGGLLVLTDWAHDFVSCVACSWYLWAVTPQTRSSWDILSLHRARALAREAGLSVAREELYHLQLRPWGIWIAPRWGMMTLIGTRSDKAP